MGICRRTEQCSACSTWGVGQAHLALPAGKLLISVGEKIKYVLEIYFFLYLLFYFTSNGNKSLSFCL